MAAIQYVFTNHGSGNGGCQSVDVSPVRRLMLGVSSAGPLACGTSEPSSEAINRFYKEGVSRQRHRHRNDIGTVMTSAASCVPAVYMPGAQSDGAGVRPRRVESP
jgi:hypothetical protein